MICEKCKAEMVGFIQCGSCGGKCPQCGWNFVTSYFESVDLDKKKYTISVKQAKKTTIPAIKAISIIFHCNYLEARDKLIKGFVMEKLSAKNARIVLRKLKESGIEYSVKPKFLHEI